MCGHQTLACSASRVLAAPRCPPRAVSWSSRSTVSRNPPPLGNTNWSRPLCTRYKTGCSPPPRKWKVASGPEARERRSKRAGSTCYARATRWSQPGSTTMLFKRLKKSGTTAATPGRYSNARLKAPKNCNQRIWWDERLGWECSAVRGAWSVITRVCACHQCMLSTS